MRQLPLRVPHHFASLHRTVRYSIIYYIYDIHVDRWVDIDTQMHMYISVHLYTYTIDIDIDIDR